MSVSNDTAAVRADPAGALVTVRVVPRASSTGLAGIHNGAVRLRVQAPPLDGKANAAVLEALAGILGVRPRDLDLISGQRSRTKTVRVHGSTPGPWPPCSHRVLSADPSALRRSYARDGAGTAGIEIACHHRLTWVPTSRTRPLSRTTIQSAHAAR
jgi:hypothetical protein